MAVQELRLSRTTPLSPWLPVCTGFLAAEITAAIVCILPDAHHRWLPRLVVRSLLYVLATVAAGLLGTLFPAWLTNRQPEPATPLLARLSFVGWVFFPAIVLLYRQRSPLLLLAVALACVPLATGLQRLSAFVDRDPLTPPAFREQRFPSLYGLPAPEYHPATKFLIAALLASAAAFAYKALWALAAICFAGSVLLATWRWTDLTSHMRHRRRPGRRARIRMTATATFLTFLALLYWSARAGSAKAIAAQRKAPASPGSAADATHPGSDYIGVILLPPKVEKKELVAPAPPAPAITLGLARPVIIPFDGPYWFFKAPARRPGANAHVVHGKPTDVNVRSSDADPLRMEAHQVLGSVVDLRCCSAMDLKVRNADTHPGEIDLGIVLTDTSDPARTPLYLGAQTLPSSKPIYIPHDRAPVVETMHFTIPPEAHSLRFNEITVLFSTAPYHARYGARVQIENFTLIPR